MTNSPKMAGTVLDGLICEVAAATRTAIDIETTRAAWVVGEEKLTKTMRGGALLSLAKASATKARSASMAKWEAASEKKSGPGEIVWTATPLVIVPRDSSTALLAIRNRQTSLTGKCAPSHREGASLTRGIVQKAAVMLAKSGENEWID
jgi:hypothetical protein